MADEELKDALLRLAIIGKVMDLDEYEARRKAHQAAEAAPSASAANGSIITRTPTPGLRVHDPQSMSAVSYVRSHVVGISPEHPDSLASQLTIASGPSNLDIESASSFVPVYAFSQFPQEYIYDAGQENYITHHFFKKIWDRSWDLFFLPVPNGTYKGPLILIPESQARNMLIEINTAITENLDITVMDREGLVLHFEKSGIPKPFYLGKTNTPREKADLEVKIPLLRDSETWENYTKGCDAEKLAEFTEKMMTTILRTENQQRNATTAKKKLRAQKKTALRIEMHIKLAKLLQRLQEWLGLRCYGPTEHAQLSVLRPVNVLMAPEWPFYGDVVFVGIDCEWVESTLWSLTEVGLSILDTRDLANLPPGDFGGNWKKRIQSHHFRVSEYQYHVNSQFCQGCPDRFEWGRSAIIDENLMGAAIDSCIDSNRNVIVVGLNMKHDMELIGRTGSSGFGWSAHANDSGTYDCLDISDLFRVLRGTNDKLGIVRLMNELNEAHTDSLHNAGNDARYTMHILIRIALEAAGERPVGSGMNMAEAYLKAMAGQMAGQQFTSFGS